jgi:hypothetical protein
MSVEMHVDVSGVLELEEKMEYFDETMRAYVDQGLDSGLQNIETLALIYVPRRTGFLASTVFVEKVKEWAFRMGARAPYAIYQELGTRFIRGRRFLSRALEEGMPLLVQLVNQAIDEAISEASTR